MIVIFLWGRESGVRADLLKLNGGKLDQMTTKNFDNSIFIFSIDRETLLALEKKYLIKLRIIIGRQMMTSNFSIIFNFYINNDALTFSNPRAFIHSTHFFKLYLSLSFKQENEISLSIVVSNCCPLIELEGVMI